MRVITKNLETIPKLFFAVGLSCWVALAASTVYASQSSFLTVDKFEADLKTKNLDLILKDLNSIPSMKYKGEILPFIQDLWDQQTDRYPDLPWKTIRTNVVKVHLADILLQAHENGYIKANKNELRHFILRMLKDSNITVQMQALKASLYLDDKQTIQEILHVAKQQEKWTFRLAVFTLAQMCHPAANRTLEDLEQALKDSDKKAFVREERERGEIDKGKLSWCESKFKQSPR